jgi:uncharacterized protein YaiE (UPF0345 family)
MKYKVEIVKLDVLEYKAFNPGIEKPDYDGKVQVMAKTMADTGKNSISIIISIEMHCNTDNDALILIGIIKTLNTFTLTKEDWKKSITVSKSKMLIDDKLDNYLIDISYHNTRGLLRERGRNDLFGNILLPLVTPGEIEKSAPSLSR